MVSAYIANKSNPLGMFLYAELVMKHLYALETQKRLLSELHDYGLPNGLEDA